MNQESFSGKPDWKRLDDGLGVDEAAIQGVYEEPTAGRERSADAMIDQELAQAKVDQAFAGTGSMEEAADRMMQERTDAELLASHPDAAELRQAGHEADLETYNQDTTSSMVELMHGLTPGESRELMHFPLGVPEGFEASDGLKQLVLFAEKAGLSEIHLPAAGEEYVGTAPGGYEVRIRVDGSGTDEMIKVTAARVSVGAQPSE
jgi:hypothetical protein